MFTMSCSFSNLFSLSKIYQLKAIYQSSHKSLLWYISLKNRYKVGNRFDLKLCIFMTSEGLVEMFEGDICAKNCPLILMGGWVAMSSTHSHRECGPPLVIAEISNQWLNQEVFVLTSSFQLLCHYLALLSLVEHITYSQ